MNRAPQSLVDRQQSASGNDDARAVGSALLGEAAVLVWNDVAPEAREQFYRWHDHEHIPERLSLPGFRRGRRFISRGHSPEWLTMYEADNLATLTSPDYLARLNAPTTATLATVRHFRNTSRAVCSVVQSLGSSTGGHMLAMRLDVERAGSESMRRYLCSDALPRVMRLTGVVACHLYAADRPASYADTTESTARTFDVPAWALLCESTLPDAALEARKLIEGREFERIGVQVSGDAAIYALEICRLSPTLEIH